MEQTLKQFISENLYESCYLLLDKLNIKHTQEEPTPMRFQDYYESQVPQYIENALRLTTECYYIGEVCDDAIMGVADDDAKLVDDLEKLRANAHYQSMMLFAVDLQPDSNVTRTDLSVLTRAFNRLVYNFPVSVIFRQGKYLSIGTCERTEFKQEWKQGQGEKLGKVSLLRNVDCQKTHQGHIRILIGLECGDCATFDKLYEKWQKVFNSEVLTKQFYNDLFEWYQWAISDETGVTFPGNVEKQEDDREDIDTCVIRLITRLMFVWFIKQKGLVPSSIFDKEYVATILKNFDAQSETEGNYYQAILQNLFFGTLNRPVIEDGERRGFAEASTADVKNLYRYAEMFSISKNEVIELFANVPFLNCGLFECLDKTKTLNGVKNRYWKDGFSRNDRRFKDGTFMYRAFVPNILFFHPTKGIISIFNKYVFTIEENTPQDVQVALDPELLGKVFENLLGAYNPETKETARNESGSFYTPREIVQYMVNESLVAHLKQTVGEELEPQYRQLLDYTTEDISLTSEQKAKILHSLFNCKILDPACGSGAFPMGMLQQMVHILQQVDPDNTQWRDILLNMAVDESRRAFGIVDEDERKKKLLEIEETFNNGLNSPDYTRKLYIIESCIYGVDIQPIAMLISRLRFFITLICEQTDIQRDKPELNFGIKTLPNLESKFVAANSLINADIHQYNEDWTKDEVLALLKNELIAIRRRHFYTRKRSEKIRLLKEDEAKRKQIHEHINRLVSEPNEAKILSLQQQIAEHEKSLESYQGENWVEKAVQKDLFSEPQIVRVDRNKRERDRINIAISACRRDIEHEQNKCTPQGFEAAVLQVTEWNPYDQNSVSPFLDIEWMFGVTDGFDIVIGNPPYIQLQNDNGKLANLYEYCSYQTFTRMGDIYCLFYERGWQLIKNKGHLCYITSNKWMRAGYGEKTRGFLSEKSDPVLLIDFAGVKIFESATVDTNILLVSKIENQHKTVCAVTNKQNKESINNLSDFVQQHKTMCKFSNSNSWVILSSIEQSIKQKIEKYGIPLKKWDVQINYGIKTGFNDAFVISSEKRNEILAKCKTNDEREKTTDLIRPILRGRDIKQRGYEWANLWLIYLPWHFPCQFDDNIQGASEDAEIKFKSQFPSVYAHMLQYKEQLSKRNKAETGIRYEWYAMQRWGAKYWEDFYKPKLFYADITQQLNFCFCRDVMFCNNTTYFIATENENVLEHLNRFLNSPLIDWYYRTLSVQLGAKAVRMFSIYVLEIPIPSISDENVYKAYHLNDTEIAFIENRSHDNENEPDDDE